jgi:hypothetical protein
LDEIVHSLHDQTVWQVLKPLRSHPLAVGQARNFCARRLWSVLDARGDIADADEVIRDATTIASELVTNAVSAGSSQIELFLALRRTSLLIEVSDDADGTVVPAAPTPEDIKGRGLLIVAALSQAWGVEVDGRIKRVWAEVPLSGAGPATLAPGPSSYVA